MTSWCLNLSYTQMRLYKLYTTLRDKYPHEFMFIYTSPRYTYINATLKKMQKHNASFIISEQYKTHSRGTVSDDWITPFVFYDDDGHPPQPHYYIHGLPHSQGALIRQPNKLVTCVLYARFANQHLLEKKLGVLFF